MGWVKEELKEEDDGRWLLWCEHQKTGGMNEIELS